MNKIFAIAKKNMLVRFSSPSQLLFFIVLPLIFTFVLGGGAAGAGVAAQDARPRVAVVNESSSSAAAELMDALRDSSAIAASELTREQAQTALDNRDVATILTIPKNFGAGGWALAIKSQANSLNAQAAERAIANIASQTSRAQTAANFAAQEAGRIKPFASEADRAAFVNRAATSAKQMLAQAPSRLNVTHAVAAGATYDDEAQASAGQLITWTLIPLLSISAFFAYERAQGTQKRAFATPTSKAQLLIGTIGGEFFTAMIQMGLMVAFGIFVMGLGWGRQPVALVVMLVALGLAGASMGVMLGAFVKTEGQAQGLSIMLGMVLALLGGCWYPLEMFPQSAQTAAQITPTYWAMRGMSDILARGVGLQGALLPAGMLMAFAAVFLSIGVWRFRVE